MSRARKKVIDIGLLAVIASVAFSGCSTGRELFEPNRVEVQEDAAGYYVSAYPSIPWSEIKEKLEPKFELTADQAVGKAVVATQSLVSQFLSMLSAAVGLSLPQSSSTSTTSVADGKSTVTGSSQRSPGSIPSSPAAVPPIGAADLAPSFSASGLTGVDTSLLYLAGTALYQQVQLYNAYISKAHYPAPEQYRGHLITLQVNLQPRMRNLPYDAYLDISVQPGEFLLPSEADSRTPKTPAKDFLPPAIVVPMLITDNLETATVARSVESIRQAGVQLGALLHGVGIRADVGSASDDLKSAQAFDKNSLLTLGRVNDSTLRVRLGAAQQGTSRYAMVPRTHNVSFVIFVPKEATSVFIITRTTLRNAETGVELDSRRYRARMGQQVHDTIEQYGFRLNYDCELLGTTKLDKQLDFLQYLDMGDYDSVFYCLKDVAKHPGNKEQRLRRMLSALMEIQTESRYSKLRIALKPFTAPKLPPNDFVTLVRDDGKTISTVLSGGKGLSADALRVFLWPNKKVAPSTPPAWRVLASKVSINEAGTDIDVQFPSLASIKKMDTTAEKSTILVECAKCDGDDKNREYPNLMLVEAAEKEKPVSLLIASTTSVIADAAGNGTVSLQIGDLPKAQEVLLVATGGDIRSVSDTSATRGAKGLVLSKSGPLVVTLANLSSARTVVLQAVESKSGKAIGVSASFTVERAAGAK